MRIDYSEARSLLRRCRRGALGTHSLSAPGFPFVSALPYVPDGAGRPLFLLSELAEHTRNLLADPRVSLLVTEGGGSLAEARLTLLGEVAPVQLDAVGTARYLRYSPESADYLALGDFRFFRLQPLKARFIGGFGRMGWIAAEMPLAALAPEIEAAAVDRLGRLAPPGVTLLGLDFEGIDVRIAGVFRRVPLTSGDGSVAALEDTAGGLLMQLEAAPSASSDSGHA